MTLITRTGKGSKLTIQEMDGNLTYLESANVPININYADLYTTIISEKLIPGSWYRLTDYKSVNFLNGWEIANNNPTPVDPSFDPRELFVGAEEILLVQAISNSELSPTAYSEKFSQDIIEYLPYANKIGVNLSIANGNTLPDSSTVSGFDLQWDGTNVYFEMPTGYPALYGHYFYLYAEFLNFATGPISSTEPNISASGDFTGLEGNYTEISPSTLTGSGSGLILDVGYKRGAINFVIREYGDDYAVGDTLLILGSLIGGVDGVNDATITVLAIDAESTTYYQDGNYEPLAPNGYCQYPSTNDDPDWGYPKVMSRIRLENNGQKVVLLDLTEQDFLNYEVDTLYVDHVESLGDAYGYITRRCDTQNKIDVPFDFRWKTFRRYEVDLSAINSSLRIKYWGIGDDFLGQGTTGNYKDLLSIDWRGYEVFNLKIEGQGGIDMYSRNGYTENVFLGGVSDCNIGSLFYNNTIDNSFINNTIGNNFNNNTIDNGFNNNTIDNGFNNNTIGYEFFNNTIDIDFNNNTIRDSFQSNTIGYGFGSNTIGGSFKNNTIGDLFQSNTIGNNMEKNIINDNFFNNIISSSQFRLNIIKTTVNNIDFRLATHVYGVYNCEIFTRSNSTLQLSYIDGTNTVQYSAIIA
jgi:hypothetical protein